MNFKTSQIKINGNLITIQPSCSSIPVAPPSHCLSRTTMEQQKRSAIQSFAHDFLFASTILMAFIFYCFSVSLTCRTKTNTYARILSHSMISFISGSLLIMVSVDLSVFYIFHVYVSCVWVCIIMYICCVNDWSVCGWIRFLIS